MNPKILYRLGVSIATGLHLIPSRTQKLSPSAAILVPRKLGANLARRPHLILDQLTLVEKALRSLIGPRGFLFSDNSISNRETQTRTDVVDSNWFFSLIIKQITRLSKVIHVNQLAQKDLDDPSQ